MGLRATLFQLISAPLLTALEAPLRELVDRVIDGRDLVRRSEIEVLGQRIDAFRRELAERRTEIAALQQAMAAWELDADEIGLDSETEGRLARAVGAVDVALKQLDDLEARVGRAGDRAEKAWAVASSALSTAEAASDGVSALESAAGG